jgi:hypothetical protein
MTKDAVLFEIAKTLRVLAEAMANEAEPPAAVAPVQESRAPVLKPKAGEGVPVFAPNIEQLDEALLRDLELDSMLSVSILASNSKVDSATIRGMLRNGLLPGVESGGRWIVPAGVPGILGKLKEITNSFLDAVRPESGPPTSALRLPTSPLDGEED